MSSATATDALPVVRAHELDEPQAERRWLVASLWARAGVGMVGGSPKCCKSWLGLDMALSVASATPCLDRFEVSEPGPVLLYMAEDAATTVKARLDGLCRHRDLDLAAQPVHVITAPSLRLDLEADQRRLRRCVADLRPRLLLLDPFVRLHRIDENHAGDVSALLAYLRGLQRAFDLAVVVVHHARKNGRAGQPGQNLRGSGDFHAWSDSSLYLRRQRDQLTLTPEHRAAPAPEPMTLRLHFDERGEDTHLQLLDQPIATRDAGRDLDTDVIAALREAPRSRTELRAHLAVRNQTLGLALQRLADAGSIVKRGDRWAIPVPAPIDDAGTERQD